MRDIPADILDELRQAVQAGSPSKSTTTLAAATDNNTARQNVDKAVRCTSAATVVTGASLQAEERDKSPRDGGAGADQEAIVVERSSAEDGGEVEEERFEPTPHARAEPQPQPLIQATPSKWDPDVIKVCALHSTAYGMKHHSSMRQCRVPDSRKIYVP